MTDYFIYAQKDTGYFAKISDREINDSNLIQAESMPPDINHKWNGLTWSKLSNSEIEKIQQDIEPPALGENEIETGGGVAEELLKAINQLVVAKDRQSVIETMPQSHDKTTWQQIAGMKLISKNLSKSRYAIAIELLTKTNKNNRDFEFALFINGKQQTNNSLHIDFNKAWDDKTLSWSDEIELDPGSVVALYWRRVGNTVRGYVERRKLTIAQLEGAGLVADLPEPEPPKSDWLFLGFGGKEFSHGNETNNDIRYRSTMEMIRDEFGMFFKGDKPFSSWVKFEFLKWKRGEGKTLKVVFVSTTGAYQIGIGSTEIDEKSKTLYYGAELMAYMSDRILYNIVGNRGKPWQGTETKLNKSLSSNYHRLEIENDGSAGSAIRLFDLPHGNPDSWNNKDDLVYEGEIEGIHKGDAKILMPFAIATNGKGLKIIAIQTTQLF